MTGEYNSLLVGLSYVVSVLGALTALQLAIGIPVARGPGRQIAAVMTAALAMGGGAIWSMHFIAMLAYEMSMPVHYDMGLTVLSAVIAVVSCAVGLAMAGIGTFTMVKVLPAGLFMGLGVAGMHYTGMEAMIMPAAIHYSPSLVALSLLIAVVASMAALWLAFALRGGWQMIGSALVMGMAVCGMHYTGMASARYTPERSKVDAGVVGALEGEYLGLTIFLISAVLLTVVLATSHVRHRRRQAVTI